MDEDDVRVRPSRRGSRPRTRTRPAHADAVPGLVVAVDRGRMTVRVEGPGGAPVDVTAMRARELGRHGVVVGDRVRLVGDTSGRPDSLARIVVIEDRTTSLRRTADDTDPTERVVVANADVLVIVTSVTDPEPALGFLDRCLVAAYAGGLEPLLCLTKTDLASPRPLLDRYAGLGLEAVPMSRELPLADLLDRVRDRMSVFVGQSGVGKSTLVNRLVPDALRATGDVSKIGKGRHTSSSAVLFDLPGGGTVIDTPGIRSFGLAHVTADDVLVAFEDIAEAATECPPGCGHTAEDPDCALDAWAADGPPVRREQLDAVRVLLDAVGQVGPGY
ncbi:ribosome small subunit-dependent GTPase A [Blastococcus sp. MG754426]|uniref:ribosome small subunit-dependent GTPase A n=1 Tax=unclassified Blastococcus TaxID=2619396 RepID=UPI001EF0D8AD|nr:MULTISPECIES: ribosome small subunit-dependent GTPase A [unclassified Blastococcus]MCF6506020.1 ribosome small subunit-dependent GTPase A [Blastococcus sp. MG754426]MCF6510594.1 ribosome small subunit-dependent GTPase A [Blastococcus sp. MG754427]MCF6736972.1 ribosome small subunit-dependent GTPase A [Blastococcus sp. KM273129]